MLTHQLPKLVRHSSTSAQIPKLVRVPNKFNNKSSASNVKPTFTPGLHHHPAPSAGNIETPDVFLPQNDPRKGLDLSGRTSALKPSLAPPLSTPRDTNYNLTPQQVEEIRSLRMNEPEKWTRRALAERFGVSGFTISLVADANPERSAEMQSRLGQIKSMWSEGRKKARIEREKRKEAWYRDE